MKKLILGLMLLVSGLVYGGGISQMELMYLLSFMNDQHEEHPGWVSVNLRGDDSYIRNATYFMAGWCDEYGYKLEYADQYYGGCDILLLNKQLLKKQGLMYDSRTGRIVKSAN